MPRKRRIVKLARRQLTWDDVGIGERLRFWVAWRPPETEFGRERSHWATWQEFLDHWAAVRAEALPEWHAKRAWMRAGCEAEVARRRGHLAKAFTDSDRDLCANLLAWAEENLAKEEAKELPFAERCYQRVLAGRAPDGRDDGDEESLIPGG